MTNIIRKAYSRDDYAYTPSDSPDTWKLPIYDARHCGMAKAALTKGFMGNRVDIPDSQIESVVSKVNQACEKFGLDTVDVDSIKESCKAFHTAAKLTWTFGDDSDTDMDDALEEADQDDGISYSVDGNTVTFTGNENVLEDFYHGVFNEADYLGWPALKDMGNVEA